MRICVVGNGPSAEDKGELIDACDFVVRMKQFWAQAALQTGVRIDAWATCRGKYPNNQPAPNALWITETVQNISRYPAPESRLTHLLPCNAQNIRWLCQPEWEAMSQYLGAPPSTGFVAVYMALQMRPSELLLCGFDALGDTTNTPIHPHNFAAEKTALAMLRAASWLGAPCNVRLQWLGMPPVFTGRSSTWPHDHTARGGGIA